MERQRVVHPASDLRLIERLSHLVAVLRTDHVEVPDRVSPTRDEGRLNGSRQLGGSTRPRAGAARRSRRARWRSLTRRHRRLQRVETLVASDHDMLVLPPLAEVSQHTDLVGELRVVGDHTAGVTVRS